MKFREITEEEKQCFVAKYDSGSSLDAIAKEYRRCRTTISNVIKERRGDDSDLIHRTRGQNSRIYDWNDNFFNERTETTAYWAGFLMADGSLGKLPYTFRLTLNVHKKDADHMVRYSESLGMPRTRVRSIGRDQVSVRVVSKSLLSDLAFWGIVPRKTYNHVDPMVSDTALLVPFLRGWFDGDGYISTRNNKHRFRVTGNKHAMMWYGEALKKIGYSGNVSYEYSRDPDAVWSKVVVSGRRQLNEVIRLLSPDGCVKLDRKWPGLQPCPYHERRANKVTSQMPTGSRQLVLL